ncbi:hypothetical protein B0T17DRAFT_510648 [Bombardia bombarda]|uniref:Uncharacterized protein n=1 Tax=Bombardia bombarda TaxID=252184 RepID=A0AA39WIP3_9PEZI|nr:hypothetical protein B0T17DRAFT_510648 [Bombardia bombarda]
MATAFGSSATPPLFSSDHPWVWVLIPVGIVVALGGVAVCLHSRRRRPQRSRHANRATTAAIPGSGVTDEGGGGRGILSSRLDPSRTRALERDLEEAWVRGATTTTTGSRGNTAAYLYHARSQQANMAMAGSSAAGSQGRWARPANRWQWAGVSRPEEGLNELGEAPPPYEKAGDNGAPRTTTEPGLSCGGDGNVSGSCNDESHHHHDADAVELRNLAPPQLPLMSHTPTTTLTATTTTAASSNTPTAATSTTSLTTATSVSSSGGGSPVAAGHGDGFGDGVENGDVTSSPPSYHTPPAGAVEIEDQEASAVAAAPDSTAAAEITQPARAMLPSGREGQLGQ